MKNSIQKTFTQIRKLPVAVSFQQVEHWVKEHQRTGKIKKKVISVKIKSWQFSKN